MAKRKKMDATDEAAAAKKVKDLIDNIAGDVTVMPLSVLVYDKENARTHPPRNLEAIRNSYQLFGQLDVLLVQRGSNMVIGGNGRLQVMRELGWTKAQVKVVDVDDLKARQISIALNRTAELAEWDFQQLSSSLKMLQLEEIQLDKLGYQTFELEPLLATTWQPPPSTNEEFKEADTKNAKGPAGKGGTTTVELNEEQMAWLVKASEGLHAQGSLAQDATHAQVVESLCRFYVDTVTS